MLFIFVNMEEAVDYLPKKRETSSSMKTKQKHSKAKN